MYVSQVGSNSDSVWNQLLTVELCEVLGQVTHRAREFIHMIDQCDTSNSSSINENENDNEDGNDSDPSTIMGIYAYHTSLSIN